VGRAPGRNDRLPEHLSCADPPYQASTEAALMPPVSVALSQISIFDEFVSICNQGAREK
jgi:hypothetical protein